MKPDYQTIIFSHKDSVATVTLNRPQKHNAFNAEMMTELAEVMTEIDQANDITMVFLKGAGASFCAGADLQHMKDSLDKSPEQNKNDALKMANLFQIIDQCSKVVIGVAKGAVFGGGTGLLACCDVVLAHQDAIFSFSEVKLGLVPAVISPFIIQKIGGSLARRYFVTAERFDARSALKMNLIHMIFQNDAEQGTQIQNLQKTLSQNSPVAMTKVKELLRQNQKLTDKKLTNYTAALIADLRASDDAQKRLTQFLDKRAPS